MNFLHNAYVVAVPPDQAQAQQQTLYFVTVHLKQTRDWVNSVLSQIFLQLEAATAKTRDARQQLRTERYRLINLAAKTEFGFQVDLLQEACLMLGCRLKTSKNRSRRKSQKPSRLLLRLIQRQSHMLLCRPCPLMMNFSQTCRRSWMSTQLKKPCWMLTLNRTRQNRAG